MRERSEDPLLPPNELRQRRIHLLRLNDAHLPIQVFSWFDTKVFAPESPKSGAVDVNVLGNPARKNRLFQNRLSFACVERYRLRFPLFVKSVSSRLDFLSLLPRDTCSLGSFDRSIANLVFVSHGHPSHPSGRFYPFGTHIQDISTIVRVQS